MAFNAHGYLDAGLHKMDIGTVEDEFVVPFPHSTTRKTIIDGYKKHSIDLLALISKYVNFIDGSFVTNKNDPGDIDLVCFIDGDMLDALPLPTQAQVRALLSGPVTKASHSCDAYFCPTYPETHVKFGSYRSMRKYWMGEFGYDRSDVPKGIVVIEENAAPAPVVAAPAAPGVGP